MSKQSHTPGPWVVTPNSFNAAGDGQMFHESFVGPGNMVVAIVPGGYEYARVSQSDIDAHLIAAAPDLLHALIMVRDADNDCHKDGLQTIPPVARHCIDAALAKAEGGAS